MVFEYLAQQFAYGSVDSAILVVKLAGTLGLANTHRMSSSRYTSIAATRICITSGCFRSACRRGDGAGLHRRDATIASLLSFRTLEELFHRVSGRPRTALQGLIGTARTSISPNVRESHRRKPLRSARQAGCRCCTAKSSTCRSTPRATLGRWHTRPHTNRSSRWRAANAGAARHHRTALCSFGPVKTPKR